MRVLFVSHVRPWPLDTGGSQRTHALVKALAARHHVTLATVEPRGAAQKQAAEETYRSLDVRLVWVRDASALAEPGPRPGAAVRAVRAAADLATHWLPAAFRRQSAPWTAALAPLLPEADAAFCRYGILTPSLFRFGLRRVVVDADDLQFIYTWRSRVEQSGPGRLLTVAEAARTWVAEQVVYARAARVLVCSREDAGRLLARRKSIVPNGISLEDGARAPREPDTVLCVGNWRYPPNRHGLRWFIAQVWPRVRAARPAARLRVVGLDATPERLPFAAAPAVELIPDVPSVRPFVESATVSAVPVFVAGGTRIKILESLGYGTPVVATPVGASGLIEAFDASAGLIVAPDAGAMAARIAEVLADPAPATARAATGAALVAGRYSWEAVARPVADGFAEWVGAAAA